MTIYEQTTISDDLLQCPTHRNQYQLE